MKKIILFAALAFTALLFTSCENDDIVIERAGGDNMVSMTVTLSDFFSSYNFVDSKHYVDVADQYRTFYSADGMYIQSRVLFYNSSGMLADSVVTYSTNTNAVSIVKGLAAGKYTAVVTLTFATKNTGNDASLWCIVGRESLNTAYLECKDNTSQWSIMSYASQEFTIDKGGISLTLNPKPVGALAYVAFDNFQYASRNDCINKTASDTQVRQIALSSQDVAVGYRLNPHATERYIYLDDAGITSLHDLISVEPGDMGETYFKNNFFGFCYILAPQCNLSFRYRMENESVPMEIGNSDFAITAGQNYLAYWDYLQRYNPYFGKADNNHWHSYGAPLVQ